MHNSLYNRAQFSIIHNLNQFDTIGEISGTQNGMRSSMNIGRFVISLLKSRSIENWCANKKTVRGTLWSTTLNGVLDYMKFDVKIVKLSFH